MNIERNRHARNQPLQRRGFPRTAGHAPRNRPPCAAQRNCRLPDHSVRWRGRQLARHSAQELTEALADALVDMGRLLGLGTAMLQTLVYELQERVNAET